MADKVINAHVQKSTKSFVYTHKKHIDFHKVHNSCTVQTFFAYADQPTINIFCCKRVIQAELRCYCFCTKCAL